MEDKTSIIQKLIALYQKLIGLFQKQAEEIKTEIPVFIKEETPQQKLYRIACSYLGQDVSPLDDKVSDEYACAETVSKIVQKAFGDFSSDAILSTTLLFYKLKNHQSFKQVLEFEAGNIIISPTGYGNGHLANGHTGICGMNGKIMSNNSATGIFKENYTIDSWIKRYRVMGGFPIFVFKRVL